MRFETNPRKTTLLVEILVAAGGYYAYRQYFAKAARHARPLAARSDAQMP
jgi:hypothetical protein